MKTVAGFITCANTKEAQKIAQALLRKRLAEGNFPKAFLQKQKRLIACANILPKIESHYWWKGRMQKSSEALLIIKTRKSLMKKIIKEIKALHSYELPVIEFFETKVNREAKCWIERETGKK